MLRTSKPNPSEYLGVEEDEGEEGDEAGEDEAEPVYVESKESFILHIYLYNLLYSNIVY